MQVFVKYLDRKRQTKHSGVTGCTVRDLGCIGLRVGGGNTTTLVRGNNLVHGNTVARNARWKRT